MRPHTCALIGVLNYIHRRDKGTDFRVRVKIPSRANRPYQIRVRSRSDREMRLEVSDFWSCQVRVTIDGDKYTLEHQHTKTTYTSEEFRIYGNRISDGKHHNPTVSKDFEGYISNFKELTITDRVRNVDYEVEVESASE